MRSYILVLSTVFIASGKTFPDCTESGFFVRDGTPVPVRPADFLEVGAVAQNCADQSCQSSESFRVNSTDSCSVVCSKVKTCDWWTSRLISESERLNRTVCYLFNTNGSSSINGIKFENATSGHRSCSANKWPECIVQDRFIPSRGSTEMWINASKIFGISSTHALCNEANCQFTDAMPIPSIEECGAYCGRLEGCHSWSVTREEGGLKCWFRRYVAKTVEQKGAVSGDAACGNHSPYIKLNFVP